MALYFPVTEKSEEDVKNKISIWNNLLSPTDGNIVAVPNQDIVLGIYALTKESKTDNMVIYKGKEITEGRKKFNDCLPIDYPFKPCMENEQMLSQPSLMAKMNQY